MDESSVRRAAGPQRGERSYRVSLTRHCLNSGHVQLPHALRNRFPEGILVAHDVEHDETVHLHVTGPRDLEGLDALFARHDLHVNDQLELRFAGDGHDVHIAVHKSAPANPSEHVATRDAHEADTPLASPQAWRDRVIPLGKPSGAPSGANEVAHAATMSETEPELVAASVRVRRKEESAGESEHPANPATPAHLNAEGQGDLAIGRSEPHVLVGRLVGEGSTPQRRLGADVVERFGSVTVRRLGSDAVSAPPETTLTPGVPNARPATRPEPRETTREAIDAFDPSWIDRGEETIDDAMLGGSRETASTREAREPLEATPARPETLDASTQPSEEPVDDPTEEDDVHPVQLGLFTNPRRAQGEGTPGRREGSRPAATRPAHAPRRMPAPLTVDDLVDLDAPALAASTAPTPTPTPAPTSTPTSIPTSTPNVQESSLVDASLQDRVGAWFADPARPVIVRLDAVRDAFELDNHETLAVVDALLANPPKGVTLTSLGPGRVRVGRTTDDGRFGS